MKNSIILFLILVPAFLFAQYPATGNKSRLGYQTTGDGLIWRGVAADTAIKPRTTANAYFQLDTVSRILRRYIATQGSWQVVGGGTNVDSLIYATRYWVGANFFPLEGGTLTGTGGAGFIGFPSQVTAPGTPASGLNVYAQGSSFNWKGTDGFERLFASTLTGGRTYTLPDISGTFAFGTGTADRSARWSATNTLAAGNITDNGTKLQALLPWQFQTYTTAGLPTGVTGYTVYNTTTNGLAWYQGSRWAYGLESTFNRGTSTYVPFFDANGQLTEHTGIRYNSAASDFGLGGAPSAQLHLQGNKSAASWTTNGIGLRYDAATYTNTTSSGTVAAQTAHNIGAPSFASTSSTTITDAVNLRVLAPTAGANTTLTRTWGIAAERAWISSRLYASPSPFGVNAQGFANSFYTTTPFYSYTGQLSSSNAGIVSQALANATNITTIGIIGAAMSGSAAITGTLYGIIGEAAGQQTMTSGTAYAIYGQARPSGQGGTSATIGVTSETRLQSSVVGGTQSGANYGFYGSISERNNHGTALLQGFRWAGLPASVSGSNTGITVYNPLAINFGSSASGVSSFWSYIDHKTSIGAATLSTQELDIFGDVYVRDSTRLTTTPTHTAITGLLTRDANGWVGLTGLSGLTYSGGVLSSTWLKSELESVGNVKISSTNSLTFKQGITRWTGSSEQTGTYISSGFMGVYKHTAGTFGGTIAFGDTIARDNAFYLLQDDRSNIQNYGTGRQFTIVAENTSLPGTYRWAFGARVDTSTTALSTLRVMLGDRYASSTAPVTVSVNAGVQPSESVANAAVTITVLGDAGKKAFTVNDAITTRMNGKVYFGLDSTLSFDPSTDLLRLSQYGTLAKTSAATGKTGTNINATFATDGTLLEIERKRDTTVYIDDADYDWSAIITTAQIASRYNRVIFWMTTTAAAGSDSELTLHTPDANLLQVEYLIHSVDEPAGFDNKIVFGTNNAVDSTNGLVTNYFPAAGDGIHIRAGLRSGVYKYRYSN